MASRPPDQEARNRFVVINLLRLAGVAAVLVAILIFADVIGAPYSLGYLLLVAGLIDIYVVPQVLARKWRTPPDSE